MAQFQLLSPNNVNRVNVLPSGELQVAVHDTCILNDPFDGSTVDTVYRWNPPVVAGAGSVTQSNGILTLSVGTGASSAAALSSIDTFTPVVPGYLLTRGLIFMENNPSINTHRFVGQGTPNSTAFTAATPLQDGWGWELDITGSLNACVYAGGVKTFSKSFPAPTNGAIPSILNTWFRQNAAYFFLNNLEEPVATAPFPNPNFSTLPYRVHLINHTSGPAVAPVWNVSQATVGDTGNNYQTVFNGQTLVRTRIPGKFISVNALSIATAQPVWTPASGKRFRLMGYQLSATGTQNITLADGGSQILVIPGIAAGQLNFSPTPMGNGILSAAANNVLTANAGGTNAISGYFFGTEE
jgi:hypothetical protein